MANKTSFKSGHSGNPRGRPPKLRALTAILEATGAEKCSDGKGGEIAYKRQLARMLWKAVVSGQVTFAATNREWGGDRTFDFQASEWFALVRWMFTQIDGELIMQIEDTTGDEEETPGAGAEDGIKPQIYLPDNGRQTPPETPENPPAQ